MVNAIIENRALAQWSSRPPRSILYEILIVLAVTLGAFMLFGPAAGPLLAWFLLLVYSGSVSLASLYDSGPKQPAKIEWLLFLYAFSFGMINLALIVVVLVVWAWWPLQSGDTMQKFTGWAVAITVPSALFIAFAPRLARRNGGAASKFLQGIREQGTKRFSRSFFSMSVMHLGVVSLFSCLTLTLIFVQAAEREVDGIETSWDLAVAYPMLPLTLVISATAFTIGRSLAYTRTETDTAVRAYVDDAAGGVGPDTPGRAILVPLTVAMLIAGVLIGSFVLTVLPGPIISSVETREAVDGWVATQREQGRTAAEIAAELNRAGGWSPDAPEAGLATLIGEPGQVLSHGCSIVMAAGVADLFEHGAIAWLPDEQAASDLKYCIRMTCPVGGQSEPMLRFVSSHATESKSWGTYAFTDFFRQGRAPTPGGYCTATGELSDRFRG